MPMPEVALAWGSRSIRRTFLPDWPRLAARLTAVVVFATPPFWLATTSLFTILVSRGTILPKFAALVTKEGAEDQSSDKSGRMRQECDTSALVVCGQLC